MVMLIGEKLKRERELKAYLSGLDQHDSLLPYYDANTALLVYDSFYNHSITGDPSKGILEQDELWYKIINYVALVNELKELPNEIQKLRQRETELRKSKKAH